jgi:hypothetical protein
MVNVHIYATMEGSWHKHGSNGKPTTLLATMQPNLESKYMLRKFANVAMANHTNTKAREQIIRTYNLICTHC